MSIESALIEARDTFARYAELHDSKGTPESAEKARANRELSRRMDAALQQWRSLSDPAVMHANLLRGIPCQLPKHLLLHLAGDEVQNAVAERDRMKAAICAHVNASNNEDTAGDTWGELLRVVGYVSTPR